MERIRRRLRLVADAARDAAHGARLLAKNPAFTAIALLVFAVGIGATTAIASVADALFTRSLPLREPERVMTVWQRNRATGVGRQDVAPGNGIDWLKRARSFEALAAIEPRSVNLNLERREPELLPTARVTEGFFPVVGTRMLHGRAFLPDEYRRGGPRVMVLSERMWRDRFGGDASIVGKPVRLDDEPYTVVGVMPPGFELRPFGNRFRELEPLAWLPKQGYQDFEPSLRGSGYWNVIGRIGAGVSIEAARAELDAISAQLAREHPQTNQNVVAQIVPLREHLAGGMREVLPLLLGAAALLLVVACANVANLLLAHGVGRAREFAVRQALGAGRARLVRQMLVETLLLAAAGGAFGLALARWTLDVIAALRPLDVARIDQIPVDLRGAAIACGVTLVAALVAGLMPALQLTRPATVTALREGGSSRRGGARGALVVVEVAAAVVLTVGAGLLVRSFLLIQRVDPGFQPERAVALQVFISNRTDTAPKKRAFFQQVLERMHGLPGVVAAGAVSTLPFGEGKLNIKLRVAISGRPAAPGDEGLVYTTVAGGDYFRAMGIPLIKGRLFDPTDTSETRQVALVSQSAAQAYWPGADPIGSRVQVRFSGINYDAEVVGVVGEVRHDGLDRPGRAELFLPHSQSDFGMMTFVVRTAPGSPATLQALKEQVWALDPQQPFYATATLDQLISRTLVGRRFNLFLLGGFAVATLLLAAAGVYGVMSFSTRQRTREFGVRRALGAERSDIVALVLGDGLRMAGIGVVVGILVALPLTQLLRGFLFGVDATDPLTFALVGAALVAVAAAACYVPARRALDIEPTEALRVE